MRREEGMYQGPDDDEPRWRKTMTAKTYWVSNEDGFLHTRAFRVLDSALALAAKAAEECSWKCLTPPAPDNETSPGAFMCGTLAAHGIHVRTAEDSDWGEEHDVPKEKFRQAKGSGKRVDWTLRVVIDRGTGALADGEDTLYFTGPEQADGSWDDVVHGIAGDDEVVEATVQPTPFGRYGHLIGGGSVYPLEWKQGYGF